MQDKIGSTSQAMWKRLRVSYLLGKITQEINPNLICLYFFCEESLGIVSFLSEAFIEESCFAMASLIEINFSV